METHCYSVYPFMFRTLASPLPQPTANLLTVISYIVNITVLFLLRFFFPFILRSVEIFYSSSISMILPSSARIFSFLSELDFQQFASYLFRLLTPNYAGQVEEDALCLFL